MALSRTSAGRLPRRHPDLAAFVPVYVALAILPLFAEIAGQIGWYAQNVLPQWVPGRYVLGRAWFWIGLATIAVGVGYALRSEGRLRAGRPGRRHLDAVGVAVLVPAGVLATLLVAIDVGLGDSVADAASIGYVPATTTVLARTAVAGSVLGLGYAVLFQGAIQESLRRAYGPGVAVVAVTVLAGLYRWLIDPSVPTRRWTPMVFVVLALVVATGYATVLLGRMADEPSMAAALTPRRVAAFGLAAVLGVGLAIDVINGITSIPELLVAVAWVAVLGVAARAYEETRTVLVPALTVALFQTALYLVPNIEVALGLTPVPGGG